MSKSTKVLGLSILIFIALNMCKLAIMELPYRITSNMVSYTYTQKVNQSNENQLSEHQQQIIDTTLKQASEYEEKLDKKKADHPGVPVVGLNFLLTANSSYNIAENLCRAICLGAITGGIINAIFLSGQRGKRLFRTFVILFIFLYLFNIILYGTSLVIVNQTVGNPLLQNCKSLFSWTDFLSVLIAYSIWFLVLWIVNRVYRQTSANKVGSTFTNTKTIRQHKQKMREQAEVEQNAFEMKKQFKERHYTEERRSKPRTINSEAREEIARENRKSNKEKEELEKEEKENKDE